jgi:hypothetical protein
MHFEQRAELNRFENYRYLQERSPTPKETQNSGDFNNYV